jgi:hypothetical protein
MKIHLEGGDPVCIPSDFTYLPHKITPYPESASELYRPPFVGEVSTNLLRIVGCRVVSEADPLRP